MEDFVETHLEILRVSSKLVLRSRIFVEIHLEIEDLVENHLEIEDFVESHL